MTDDALRARYPAYYGTLAFRRAPDYARCCERVYRSGAALSHQCARANGHGPGGAYCKHHDPDRAQARQEARHAAGKAQSDRESAIRALEAERTPLIRLIAAGCDDARALCRDWCERMAKARSGQ